MLKDVYFMSGLQRSGTNFIEESISKNYNVRKINNGKDLWKHHVKVPNSLKTENVIIIYKNPYTWIESIAFRNSVDFVRTQRLFPIDEPSRDEDLMIGPANFNLINLAKTWKTYQVNWCIDYDKKEKAFYVKYEDLLENKKREEIFLNLENKFNWKREAANLTFTDRGRVSQSRDYDVSREEYYKRCIPNHLSPKQIHIINNTIGRPIIAKLGYEVL